MTLTCDRCGHRPDHKTSNCPVCGTPLENAETTQTAVVTEPATPPIDQSVPETPAIPDAHGGRTVVRSSLVPREVAVAPDAEALTPDPAKDPEPVAPRFCTSCGHGLGDGAAFCTECGARFGAAAESSVGPDSPAGAVGAFGSDVGPSIPQAPPWSAAPRAVVPAPRPAAPAYAVQPAYPMHAAPPPLSAYPAFPANPGHPAQAAYPASQAVVQAPQPITYAGERPFGLPPGIPVNVGPGRPATLGEKIGTGLLTSVVASIPIVGFIVMIVGLFQGREMGGMFTGLVHVDPATGQPAPGKFFLKMLIQFGLALITFGIAPLILVWTMKGPYNQNWFDRTVGVVVMKR